jgi:hypothetical protein
MILRLSNASRPAAPGQVSGYRSHRGLYSNIVSPLVKQSPLAFALLPMELLALSYVKVDWEVALGKVKASMKDASK